MRTVILNCLTGLSFGAILFMVSSGLSLVMGVMGTLNMAQGGILMLGAYVGWTVAVQVHAGFVLGCLASGAAGAITGLVMERLFFRRLSGRSADQILLSFGLIYVMETLAQIIWGPLPVVPYTLRPLGGAMHFSNISYPISRLVLTGIALFIAALLVLLQRRTKIGATVRAGMDDRETARALGLRLEEAVTAISAVSGLVAGLGGFLAAPIFGASTDEAENVLILALVVVIVGGVGSLSGSLLGSLVIGMAVSFGATLFGGSFGYFAIYLAMILVLMVRPFGLLGRKRRTA